MSFIHPLPSSRVPSWPESRSTQFHSLHTMSSWAICAGCTAWKIFYIFRLHGCIDVVLYTCGHETYQKGRTMQLRQIEDREARPVDKTDLKPGDFAEWNGNAHVICERYVNWFAHRLDGSGGSDLGTDIYRIRITGWDEHGKLTWERIPAEP